MELSRAYRHGASIRVTIPRDYARAMKIVPGTLVRWRLGADGVAVMDNAEEIILRGERERGKK